MTVKSERITLVTFLFFTVIRQVDIETVVEILLSVGGYGVPTILMCHLQACQDSVWCTKFHLKIINLPIK